MAERNEALVKELAFQLRGGNAHAPLEKVIQDYPSEKRGVVPKGLPYSGWQLLEHIRRAQRDILEFSANQDGRYFHKKWPDNYWPKSPEPPSEEAWDKSVKQIEADREAFIKMISKMQAELFSPFPWGEGQTLFQEACLILDHNAYHLGELVAVRRVLGIWEG
jgi:hypothetical protein